MLKRTVILLLVVIGVMGAISGSYAYITDCVGGNGKHDMVGIAPATVHYKTWYEEAYYTQCQTFKCDNCGELFVCTGRPHTEPTASPILFYWYEGELDLQSAGGVYVFETDQAPHYTEDTTLPGFTFRD